MSVDLPAAGAAKVGAREPRLMDGDGDSECLMEAGNCNVWKLPPRPAQKEGCHGRRMGVMLGPDADSPLSRKADTVLVAPPGVR